MKTNLQPTQENYLKLLELGENLPAAASNLPGLKVALLSDSSPQRLASILKGSLYLRGFKPLLYEAAADTCSQEALDPDSGCHRFKADFIVLNTCAPAYRERWFGTPLDQRPNLASRTVDEVLAQAHPFLEKGSRVVCATLAPLEERLLGNYSALVPDTLYRSVLDYNRLLCERLAAIPGCLVHDVMALAMRHGLMHWHDPRLWFSARYACAPRHFVSLAENLAGILQTARGVMTKCLVVDLDETLWGGVVGDLGVNGIDLGDSPAGRAFQCFQHHLLEMKKRGILLAVASKNDREQALEPFRKHPAMVLKEEDFAVFEASWEEKSQLLRRIAERLNIGLDSLVFVDDNPFERAQVSDALPQVAVPELREDPSHFISDLEGQGLFETLWFSEEDRRRTSQAPESWQVFDQAANLPDFLKGLEMKLGWGIFDALHFPRITQLCAKTNQFNLRTQRLTEQDCLKFTAQPQRYLPLYFTLRDRLGDHGLIAALVAEIEEDRAFILEFLMSCRVFKRRVEHAVVNCLAGLCLERGLGTLQGEYLPTPRNGLVQDLYGELGFTSASSGGPGTSRWTLDLSHFRPHPTPLTVEGHGAAA
jgi:FkbH-like protein